MPMLTLNRDRIDAGYDPTPTPGLTNQDDAAVHLSWEQIAESLQEENDRRFGKSPGREIEE